jgi:hypothetical protein
MTVPNLHLPKTFTNEEGYRGFRARPADWLMLRRELYLQAASASEADRVPLLEMASRLAPDRDGAVHLAYADIQHLLRQVALATVVRPNAADAPRRLAVLKSLMDMLLDTDQSAIRDEVRGLRRDATPSMRMAQ